MGEALPNGGQALGELVRGVDGAVQVPAGAERHAVDGAPPLSRGEEGAEAGGIVATLIWPWSPPVSRRRIAWVLDAARDIGES
ncbi:MAG: hypothetical protein V9G12_01885 [Microthrixaceae bacterium]